MAARPALTESVPLESYAAAGAQADAASGVPHSHFQNTQGGGVALAENEVLTQSLNILGGTSKVRYVQPWTAFMEKAKRITLIQDFR